MTRRRLILFRIATPILIFVLAELALRYLFDARFRLDLAERQTLAAYQGKPWARQYFKDLWSCAAQSARAHQPRYVRYVLQDINEDCTTQTVNYANRIRKTWNPDGPPGAAVYEIAMFGGSTMEGLGAIDDETIASQFSRLVNTPRWQRHVSRHQLRRERLHLHAEPHQARDAAARRPSHRRRDLLWRRQRHRLRLQPRRRRRARGGEHGPREARGQRGRADHRVRPRANQRLCAVSGWRRVRPQHAGAAEPRHPVPRADPRCPALQAGTARRARRRPAGRRDRAVLRAVTRLAVEDRCGVSPAATSTSGSPA